MVLLALLCRRLNCDMRNYKMAGWCLVVAALTVSAQADRWMAGDFHQHTFYTDGSDSFDFVMGKNIEFGLDWWANSEHGGRYNRNGIGRHWDDADVYACTPMLGDITSTDGHQNMWRWQSLRDFVWPDILRWRQNHPDKVIFHGVEWNVPAHEHCSVAIVDSRGTALSAFEYIFDHNDYDTSRDGEETEFGRLRKVNGRRYEEIDGDKVLTDLDMRSQHGDAVAACAWMQKQYDEGKIENGWIIWAHVERAGPWDPASGKRGYNIEHFRDFNNAAPDICFGFEGIPGHQAAIARGNYGDLSAGGGTYGGAGIYSAAVGGLWDALLGEGRRWFNFANSDHHAHHSKGGSSFYPGEYLKTWVYTTDEDSDGAYGLNEVADALRGGNSWSVMGDLIHMLEFSATQGEAEARMGGELHATRRRDVSLSITFAGPKTSGSGATRTVDHIDLIAGEITGKAQPGTPAYTTPTNASTRILATFTSNDWNSVGGVNVVEIHVPADRDMYYRLRGTDRPPNTAHETDALGNPLADSEAINLGLDRDAEAWADLWFYSNPIFVYVKQETD